MLDGDDEPASVEELEQVVRRAGQRRRASLVAGAVALLSVGGLVGALARGPVADETPGFASAPQEASPTTFPGAVSEGSWSPYGPLPGWTVAPLFRREANGVAIRAYRSSLDASAITVPVDPVDPACLPPTRVIQGQLSNGAAVAVADGPERPGDGLAVLSSGEFGRQEGEPATWAIVRVPAGTASARLKVDPASDIRLKGPPASDAMAPEDGIAILAATGGGPGGLVEALAADGSVIASQPLAQTPEPMFGPACSAMPCPDTPADAGPMPSPPATVPPLPPPPPGQSAGPIVVEGSAACGSVGYHGASPPPTPTTVAEAATSPATNGPSSTTTASPAPPQGAVAPTTTTAPGTPTGPPPSTAPPAAAP